MIRPGEIQKIASKAHVRDTLKDKLEAKFPTFKGIDFLIQNYRYEQTLPKNTILQDITAICRQNGGKL